MVTDTQPIDYRTDDGGDQNNTRISPINPKLLEMELRRQFCTPGVYNVSAMKFYQRNLYCVSNWHIGRNRFAQTSTINLMSHSTREASLPFRGHQIYPRYFKKIPQHYLRLAGLVNKATTVCTEILKQLELILE